ncbi:glycosyltransferase family 2 protein [Aerococcus urinaeequi]|uniref:glycosyltransferase family 2 protein n=1 Tax=Aerococcus urinaeequi TaxID=51665 RepID=UPI003D6A7068
MADLTTIILTYNEEKNIEACIESVKSISKRIIVLDSYSTDKTIEIAKSLGAEIYSRRFVSQANQFRYALDNFQITTKWVMKFDADERLTTESSNEIEDICNNNMETDINGIVLRFEVNFLGKKLRHGGIYPFRKLVVFKNGLGKIENKKMDEHIVIKEGKSVEAKLDSLHEDYKDLTTWIDKHNKYSSREVLDYSEQQITNSDSELLDNKAKMKRFLKYKLYYKLPMGLRARLYYYYRYYLLLGFLDGKEGQIFAFLQAYWYRYLVDAKIFEKNKLK